MIELYLIVLEEAIVAYLFFEFLVMSIPDNLYKKKKKNSHYFSIIFLIVIILSTLALYFYNIALSSEINKIRLSIQDVDSLTENIKKDEKVKIYSLIESNKKTLEKMKYTSQIPDFIEHFKVIWKKYRVKLKSFNYSWWKISSEVSFENKNEITYLRVVNFIRGYRESKDSLFDLKFINSIKGQNNIEFSILLDLKEQVKKVEQIKKIKEVKDDTGTDIQEKNIKKEANKISKKERNKGIKDNILKTRKQISK